MNIEEIKGLFAKIEKVTIVQVSENAVLIVHIPRDMATAETAKNISRSLDMLDLNVSVLIDNIGVSFSAIEKIDAEALCKEQENTEVR